MLTTKHIVVNSKAELFAIQNHEPGEMAMCVDTKEVFIWDEEKGWIQIDVLNKGLELNLYELNKNIGKFIRILEADEECSTCGKEKCPFSREGMVPYIENLRDITLEMRGSSNQRIINLREIDKH